MEVTSIFNTINSCKSRKVKMEKALDNVSDPQSVGKLLSIISSRLISKFGRSDILKVSGILLFFRQRLE